MMKQASKKSFRKGISPIRILPLGYLSVALIGALLLMLPAASHGEPLPFFDALFTAVSASCVTGLVVVDTGTHFTMFGQIVVIVLIQLGGLGFMTAATLLFRAAHRRISLRSRMTLAEAFGEDRLQGIIRLCMNAVKYTFLIEGCGALLLGIRFVPQFGWHGVWMAVFHSISAFCNAGFDIMGNFDSLTNYVGDPLVNITIMALIVFGGLGFTVITELRERKRFSLLSMHAKIVLTGTAFLIFAGAALFLAFEAGNADTMGGLTAPQKVMAAFFQSVTCRTAGFNTIPQDTLTDASKLLSSVLMHTHPDIDVLEFFYEITSALGTVGLTAGLTSVASTFTRAVLCALMYLGRAGIMTIALAIGGRADESTIRYPESNILIG